MPLSNKKKPTIEIYNLMDESKKLCLTKNARPKKNHTG